MSKSTNLNIRLDSGIKTEAEELFKSLGINMTTAINMFLNQAIKTRSIPFEIKEKRPNRRLMRAIKEAEKIAKDPNAKTYDSLDELFKDLET